MNTVMTDDPQPTVEDMHPGLPCCASCEEDVAFDSTYSMWPLCCCEAVRWGWKSSYDLTTGREIAVLKRGGSEPNDPKRSDYLEAHVA